MSAPRDRRDVELVLAGKTEAFEGIVQRWQGPLVQLAYRFCNDSTLAEDLAQEAFIKVLRGLKQWRGDAAFSTWLFAVASNVYRSKLRRVRPKSVPIEHYDEAVEEYGTSTDLHLSVDAKQRASIVRHEVSQLPEKYREAVAAFYFLDQDLEEAAKCLGVPSGTLKSHLFRARKLLAARLGALAEKPAKLAEETA